MDDEQVSRFAREFTAFLESVNQLAATAGDRSLQDAVRRHLGEGAADQLPVVADRYLPFEHVNVQVALEALLAGPGRSHQLVGLLGDQHAHMSLAELLQQAHQRGVGLGATGAGWPGTASSCPSALSSGSRSTSSAWPRTETGCGSPASTSSVACYCTVRPAPARR